MNVTNCAKGVPEAGSKQPSLIACSNFSCTVIQHPLLALL